MMFNVQYHMPAEEKRLRKGVLVVPDELIDPFTRRFPDLFDPVATRGLFALRALAQRIDDDYNTWLTPLGLTATKLNYLAVLYATPGHTLPLTDLSRYTHASNANVTIIMNALERAGLVRRRPNPADRRSIVAILQPKGMALIDKVFPIHHRNIKLALSGVTVAERRALISLLVKIGDGFDTLFATGVTKKARTKAARQR
jgi:MarR family transcriptional regulator, 2-MHQ and catechol-resistance regulon repressor